MGPFTKAGLDSPSPSRTFPPVHGEQLEQHVVSHVLQPVESFVQLPPKHLGLDVPTPGPHPFFDPLEVSRMVLFVIGRKSR